MISDWQWAKKLLKRFSEFQVGFEPTTSVTPGGCSRPWTKRTSGEWSCLTGFFDQAHEEFLYVVVGSWFSCELLGNVDKLLLRFSSVFIFVDTPFSEDRQTPAPQDEDELQWVQVCQLLDSCIFYDKFSQHALSKQCPLTICGRRLLWPPCKPGRS